MRWRRTRRIAALPAIALATSSCGPFLHNESTAGRTDFVFVAAVRSVSSPGDVRILIDCEQIREKTRPERGDIRMDVFITTVRKIDQRVELVFNKAQGGCPCQVELSSLLDSPYLVEKNLGGLTDVASTVVDIDSVGWSLREFPDGLLASNPTTAEENMQSDGFYETSVSQKNFDNTMVKGDTQLTEVARPITAFPCTTP